jgi:hypothetical protein
MNTKSAVVLMVACAISAGAFSEEFVRKARIEDVSSEQPQRLAEYDKYSSGLSEVRFIEMFDGTVC